MRTSFITTFLIIVIFMIKYFLTKQFVDFLMVGITSAFLHWLARWALSFWLPFSLAIIIAYVIGMSIAFALNALFVFPNTQKSNKKQACSFIFINSAFFPIVWLAATQINSCLKSVGMINYTEELAHALAVFFPMFITFLFYKFHTFKVGIHEE